VRLECGTPSRLSLGRSPQSTLLKLLIGAIQRSLDNVRRELKRNGQSCKQMCRPVQIARLEFVEPANAFRNVLVATSPNELRAV
jgi:hypothetical protein